MLRAILVFILVMLLLSFVVGFLQIGLYDDPHADDANVEQLAVGNNGVVAGVLYGVAALISAWAAVRAYRSAKKENQQGGSR